MPSFPILIDFQTKRKKSVFKGSETIGDLTKSLHLDTLAGLVVGSSQLWFSVDYAKVCVWTRVWVEGPFVTGSGGASPSLGHQT